MKTQYDALVLLGRGVSPEGKLPDSVKVTIEEAVKLFNDGRAKHVIFSGKWSRSFDFTPPLTEARAMQEYAITLGLPESVILLEEESLDTISNWYFIKNKLLAPRDWKSILFITVDPIGKRAGFLMNCILGPEYEANIKLTTYEYPSEKFETIKASEEQKLAKLEKFLSGVVPGDDETIMRMHLEYVRAHS